MSSIDKVKLKEDWFFRVQYEKGEIFTIIGSSQRGWDIKNDKTGRIIYECYHVQDKFEEYSIKDDRKKKLNKIDENR